MELPVVSVIIPHHTGRSLLARCLDSVVASKGVRPEIIVVTSDPTDGNEDVALYFLNDGPAGKRNLGVSKAHADTIVFLDDDVEISPYCCYELWRFLEEHPQCGMAFAKIYKMEEGRRDEFDDCGSWITSTGFLYSRAGNALRDTGQFNVATRCLAGKSATCIVRRTAFTEVGKFDRDYYILGEETDLAWRMWLRGWEVWCCPTAVSWHAFGCESLKPRADHYTIERTMTYGCRNYLSLLWNNLGTRRLLCILPLHLCAWNLAVVGFALRGDWRRSGAIMRGMQAFCQRLPDLQRKRRRVQLTRVVSDRQLLQSIYYAPGFGYYVNRLWRYWTTQLHG